MKLYSKRKILLLILAICIAFWVLSAESLIAREHDHICTGAGCPVCLHIEAVKCLLRTFKLAGLFALFAVCYAFFARTSLIYDEFTRFILTPIGLKVRYNS